LLHGRQLPNFFTPRVQARYPPFDGRRARARLRAGSPASADDLSLPGRVRRFHLDASASSSTGRRPSCRSIPTGCPWTSTDTRAWWLLPSRASAILRGPAVAAARCNAGAAVGGATLGRTGEAACSRAAPLICERMRGSSRSRQPRSAGARQSEGDHAHGPLCCRAHRRRKETASALFTLLLATNRASKRSRDIVAISE
jgi:hypothetical protein